MMQGLLGIDDPRTAGLLSLGLRLMSTPGKFSTALGQSGLGALTDAQRLSQANQIQRQRDEEMRIRGEMLKMQQAEAARVEEERKRQRSFLDSLQSPAQQALAGGGGPTVANAAKIDPQQQLIFGALRSGALPVSSYLQMMQKDETPVVVPEGGILSRGGKKVLENPKAPKEPKLDELIIRGPDGQLMINPLVLRAKQAIAAAGRPEGAKVIVGTGKVGELETNYRKEFTALPQVKRYNDALPAFKAVESAATRPGTQSEINLIYGLAKLYDPESVVREGEYATIANSQSIPERVKGWAQHLTGGGKLTEDTKKQVMVEARARIATLRAEHDRARKSYEAVIKRQGLDPQNVFIDMGEDSNPSVSNW